jgi:hypothetical protein
MNGDAQDAGMHCVAEVEYLIVTFAQATLLY